MSELYIEWWENFHKTEKVYTLHIPLVDLAAVNLDSMDKALLTDIGSSSDATVSDYLLGLETVVRRIEEQRGSGAEAST